MWKLAALAAAGLAALCGAQSSFEPQRPPSVPLAVKSPFMSTWQAAGSNGGNGGYLAGQWPTFWFGSITGWAGYIRVDNVTYIWMGDPFIANYTNYYVSQQSLIYTPTKSIFIMDVAGLVGMNITFTSPVLPDTILEMSLPYNYMDVEVYSIDGKHHSVQLYTDISAEWVAGDRSATAQWQYGTVKSAAQPNAVPPVASATSPPATAVPTTYATRTDYRILPASDLPPLETPIHAPGQGHHYAGQTKPPANAETHIAKKAAPKNKWGGSIAYHEVWRQQQLEFSSYANQAEWGYWYYATDNTPDLTYQSGQDVVVRAQFINNGYLADTQDTNYRAIDDDYPVFGFVRDFGSVTKTPVSALFQLSLHQQNCILFEDVPGGNVSVPCMWTNYFDTNQDALGYFYEQYSSIFEACTAFDTQVETDSYAAAPAVGKDYYSLTALAMRQAFGALAYTNTPEEPWVFLEEISSDQDIQTVDVIMPFHPIAIYANATILKWILEPIFINTPDFPFAYSMHDLGFWPNATGHNNPLAALNAEQQPLEESGNMLIMALAYAQRTNDNAWLAERYSVLRQWAEYVYPIALYPGEQLSTDDFLGYLYNDTNLAIKGIVALEAFGQIANRTGHVADGKNFTKTAHDYVETWYKIAFNHHATPPHQVSGYQTRGGNFSLLYNMFGDKECGLDLIKPEIYAIQSDFYPTQFGEYGITLRSTVTETKVDWELWCAAIASEDTKNQFISVIANWLRTTTTSLPFTDFYDTTTGSYGQAEFYARPVVGGVFSLLALNGAPTDPYYAPTRS